MRLAGTARQYSKKAMDQLTTTAIQSGEPRYFKWPYQANVMKTFERSNMMIGANFADMALRGGLPRRRRVDGNRGPAGFRHEGREHHEAEEGDTGQGHEGGVVAGPHDDGPGDDVAECRAHALHGG